jgi:hypothetical protein
MSMIPALMTELPISHRGTRYIVSPLSEDDEKKVVYFPINSDFWQKLYTQIENLYRSDLKATQNMFLQECKAIVKKKWPEYSLVQFEEIALREQDKYPAGLYLLIQRGDIDLNFGNELPSNTKQITNARSESI